MRKLLHRLYRRLANVLVPGLQNSQYAYVDTVRKYAVGRHRWLDIGCGHQLFPEWLSLSDDERLAIRGKALLIGVDLDLPSLRKNREHHHLAFGNIDHLAFRDGTFDFITANMVVEHLDHPTTALCSVADALCPSGRFIFHTPNLRSPLARLSSWLPQWIKDPLILFLEGREDDDVFPTRYRMNTEPAVRRLAREAGLEVETLRHVDSTPSTVMLGPLVIFELLWIRLLRIGPLYRWRTNLVVVLRKPADSGRRR